MKNNLKSEDKLARMGGDEFVLALSNLSSQEEAIKITQRLINKFNEPLSIKGEKINISLSAGISIYPNDGKNLEDLIKNADYAMYQAKKNNKDLEIS